MNQEQCNIWILDCRNFEYLVIRPHCINLVVIWWRYPTCVQLSHLRYHSLFNHSKPKQKRNLSENSWNIWWKLNYPTKKFSTNVLLFFDRFRYCLGFERLNKGLYSAYHNEIYMWSKYKFLWSHICTLGCFLFINEPTLLYSIVHTTWFKCDSVAVHDEWCHCCSLGVIWDFKPCLKF